MFASIEDIENDLNDVLALSTYLDTFTLNAALCGDYVKDKLSHAMQEIALLRVELEGKSLTF